MSVLGTLALGSAFDALKGWFVDALRFVAEHPWPAIAIATGSGCAWLLLVTIPGLEAERDAEAAAHAQTKENYREAQREAWYLWARQAQEEQARYDVLAQEADDAIQIARSEAMERARDYIARNRVQCPTGGTAGDDASRSAEAAGGNSAGVPSETAAVSDLVAVSERDVKSCTDLRLYAQKAHEWAMNLERKKGREESD